MKRQAVKTMLGLTMAASLILNGTAALASETEAVTETVETEIETEAETEAAPDVDVMRENEKVVTLKNETGHVIASAVWGGVIEKQTEEGETEAETAQVHYAGEPLDITEESGARHSYECMDFAVMTDPVLVMDNGFFYIRYQNVDGETKELAEIADEIEFDEPITMYVVNDVYIRAESSGDSEALGVASLGNEITVVGAAPKWYKVEQGDIKGYVARSFLSKDKESAEAAVKAEEAAAAEAQAQAAAAAAAAQAAAQQQAAQNQPQGKYEVSRQNFDDCDGSGHGYTEITYSDGSVEKVEY